MSTFVFNLVSFQEELLVVPFMFLISDIIHWNAAGVRCEDVMSLSEGVQLTYNLLMERDVRCPRHNNFFIQLPGERTEEGGWAADRGPNMLITGSGVWSPHKVLGRYRWYKVKLMGIQASWYTGGYYRSGQPCNLQDQPTDSLLN